MATLSTLTRSMPTGLQRTATGWHHKATGLHLTVRKGLHPQCTWHHKATGLHHKATGLQRTATGWHHIAILAQGHRYRLHQVLESHIATTEKAAEVGPEVKNHGEKAAEVGPALSQESRSRGGTQKIATTGRTKTNPGPNEVPFGECQAIRALQKNDYS